MAEIEFRCPSCGESVAGAPGPDGVPEYVCGRCGTSVTAEDAAAPRRTLGDSLIGERVSGVEVKEFLGEGVLGAVYRAFDDRLGAQVALKVLRPEALEDPERVLTYLGELVVAAQLDHPNLVRTHRIGRDEERDLHFVEMEWIEGEPLGVRVRREGPLPPPAAIDVALQCAEGLAATHAKGIFHGDVKPDNLLIDATGGVKLTDFGLSGALTRPGEQPKVHGTPPYMAPERFEQVGIDAQADIYSLGVTLYFLLSGALPHSGENMLEMIRSIRTGEPRPLTDATPGLPEAVWTVVAKMIARDRAVRYSDLGQVRRALLTLTGAPVVCARCGIENVAGTANCRDCGVALEEGARAAEITAALLRAVRAGRPEAALSVAAELLALPPGSALVGVLRETIADRLGHPAPEDDESRAAAADVRAYLGLGQLALAASALSQRSVLAPLEPTTAEIVTGALAAFQEELTNTLLELVEHAMRDGDFNLAVRHHEALRRVAPGDHPDTDRIKEAQRRIDQFRARQRAAADPLIGHRLGHWVIEEYRGEGAFGQVYRGTNVKLQQPVAIKFLKRQFVSDPKVLALFTREARAAAKLDHPGVVRIYGLEFDEATANHFLVLEFVDGRDLQCVLGEQPAARLPLDFTLEVVRAAAEALAEAHEAGILHRDIKPGNIMVLPGGKSKVGDFGLARELDSAPTTTLKGTPAYMSPEQWNSREDHRTDIYALGVTIYHLLSGEYPFPGSGYQIAMKVMTGEPVSLSEVRPDLPLEVSSFVARLIARDPSDRPQSMAAVVREISALAEALNLDLDGVADRHRELFSGARRPERGPHSSMDTRTLD